jgi:hypothetical protein
LVAAMVVNARGPANMRTMLLRNIVKTLSLDHIS